MNDMTKAELVKKNVQLKRENKELRKLLNGSKRNYWMRFKISLRAFFKEWGAV